MEMIRSENGIDFTGILLGKGNPSVTINRETGEIVGTGYAFQPTISKWNAQPIDSNIFCNEQYRCVSGIIITHAMLFEEYSTDNTWIFLNPFATNKVIKKDFWGATYWDADRNMQYWAHRKGRSLK